MNSTSSVATRAALAVGLMIGFYVLAVAIAGVLLYVPYAELVYAHQVHPKLALIGIVGAGTILWSILPRWDRFAAPGPRLEPERVEPEVGEPRLGQRGLDLRPSPLEHELGTHRAGGLERKR